MVALSVAAWARPAAAQPRPVQLTVRVMDEATPVPGARVAAEVSGGITDDRGEVRLRLSAGTYLVRVTHPGYADAERRTVLREGRDTTVVIALEADAFEHEEIIVTSTRTDRRIEDEPIRIEVVGREEIEEKLLMTPGDISMLLNETAGLRVQPTSPALGGAGVRIQGLRGRYTQILSDGLPLYGGQTGALGPLQIPPMDLGQVEVLKGVASALYGASALGGVVNLISRRPDEEGERELLLNQSTLGGTDGILWASRQLNDRWGYTLLASGHRQSKADPDDDGWADLPSFRRFVARPRLFWSDGRGNSVFFTAGGMLEAREGGTLSDATTPAGTRYEETLDTRRGDAGLVGRFLLAETRLLSVRAATSLQRHEHRFDDVRERDRHVTAFAETALSGTSGNHAWVLGAALQHEDYGARDLTDVDHTYTTPGIFAQDEFVAADWLTVAASARFDHHSEYGSFVNPRLSILLRPAAEWTVRASAGTGFFAPTPFTEETEAVGLHRLAAWRGLDAERARSGSLDVGRTFGPFELNATLFASRIDDPVQTRTVAGDPTRLELFNADGPVRTHGTEILARYHVEGIHVTATHVYLRSTEPDPVTGARRTVPLTPRHTAGIIAAWEQEERGRIGAEFYFTGRQRLDDNPYRDEAKPHVIVGLLIERRFGPARVFLNAENILDTRQTRHDRLVLPARAPDGRWTTDIWGPLEGRAFNGGVRWTF